ncbi:M23 family metallopeptidase [Ruminococcaceae bacterium OttesenSCG-928-D13]|nr:M23 family metallopeptidase [Ruminococcaceae bacterium OttesenSCG-928-D13]
MKKVIMIAVSVILAVALGLGIFAFVSYRQADETLVPKVTVVAFGQTLSPVEYEWNAPLWGGLMTKHFEAIASVERHLGELQAPVADFGFPSGYLAGLDLTKNGAPAYSGTVEGWSDTLVAQPGEYQLQIRCEKPQGSEDGYGSFVFELGFTVPAEPEPEPEPDAADSLPTEPEFIAGRTELQQGEIFAMRVMYLPEGVEPSGSTELGRVVFTPVENGWFAAVPVGNTRATGDYPVQVQAGEQSWEVTVTVLAFDFDEQNLIIDTTDPDISEANSPEAIAEYNSVMLAMYETYDEERYWDGVFIQPAQGWISTQFGEIRYTNSDFSSGRPHWGMDIAAMENSEVIAPNRGKVVFSDYLLAVGWTVIVEHGGGLKSYYYHMNETKVEEGQMLEQGDLIGLVGSTGYSTGAHLHFEMRMGGNTAVISPSMLFDAGAGLYSTEDLPAG